MTFLCLQHSDGNLRLDGYLQLLGEAQARQRLAASVHERRRREKSFGKVVKNAMRDKGKRRGDG